MTRPIVTVLDPADVVRLMSKVTTGSGCWDWTGSFSPLGYARFSTTNGPRAAHRLVYEVFHGPVPPELDLDHLCSNRGCVNPAHLEPVSHQENLMRGDTIVARQAAQTHCVNGHEFTPENTRIRPYSGGRACRACDRKRVLANYHKKRALSDTQEAAQRPSIGADGVPRG